MDIAALSVVMSNHQVRSEASMAVMNKMKDVMTDQGEQLTEMLEQSSVGRHIDVQV